MIKRKDREAAVAWYMDMHNQKRRTKPIKTKKKIANKNNEKKIVRGLIVCVSLVEILFKF